MSVTISYDANLNVVSVSSSLEKELSMNASETELFKTVLSFLAEHENFSDIRVERRSSDYVSLFCGENDFLRFKYSERSKWCSLRLPKSLQELHKDNVLFSAQKNKKQLHWKTSLTSLSDLETLKPFIIASCVYIS